MKRKKKKKEASGALRVFVGLLVMLLVLTVVYGAAAYYFSDHFLPTASINGVDVSLLSIDEAKEMYINSCGSYELVLKEKNSQKEIIHGDDIDLKADISESFDNLLSIDSGVKWLLNLFQNTDYSAEGMISYSYDDEMLDEKLEELKCVNPETPTEPQDARLELQEDKFVIIPHESSNYVDKDTLRELVVQAINDRAVLLNLVDEQLYIMPEVLSDDEKLAVRKEELDSIADVKLVLKFGDNEEVIDAELIADWVSMEKKDNGDYTIKTKDDKIKKYVEGIAKKYNTFDSPTHFVNRDGKEMDISPSYYGWLLDNEYAVDEIKKHIKEKKSLDMVLTDRSKDSDKWWIRVAASYDSKCCYGNDYAEVSIDQQHMWLYKDGEMVFETDIVTGNPNLGNDTPKGSFRIIYQERNATLKGPGYSTPVAYWMVFSDDVGFHDATWQYSYGGQVYLVNGSHGCVNLSLSAAEKLYGLVYPNMAVFVY